MLLEILASIASHLFRTKLTHKTKAVFAITIKVRTPIRKSRWHFTFPVDFAVTRTKQKRTTNPSMRWLSAASSLMPPLPPSLEVKVTSVLVMLSYDLMPDNTVMHLRSKRNWGTESSSNLFFLDCMLGGGTSFVNFLALILVWEGAVFSLRSLRISSAVSPTSNR